MRTAKRRLRAYLLRFLRLRGAPAKIASGFSIGGSINFFPAFFIATPLSFFLGVITRTNGAASLMGNLLFKPFWPFFFYLDLLAGFHILGHRGENAAELAVRIGQLDWVVIGRVGSAMLLGAVLNSLLFIALSFFVSFFILKQYKPWLIARLRTK